MNDVTIKLVHKISGIIVSVFISLHLFNHIWAVIGPEKHIEMMNTLRLFYRNIFAESLLLAAISVQLFSGIKLFKTNWKNNKIGFEKLQLWTGGYLLFFIVIHLTAVFGARFFLRIDTNFYFGVSGINSFPLNLFFIPYYGFAVMALFGHFAAIHNKNMKWSVFGFSPNTQSKIIMGLGLMLTIILFYGFTNHFKGVEIPNPYNLLIKQ